MEKGYQIVYLDQRGTGLSTPLEVKTFKNLVLKEYGNFEVDSQLKFILNFRADSIIRDLEQIRKDLIGNHHKWSIMGQSYGGFCCFTYLSLFPESISEVIITGGVPPVHSKLMTYTRRHIKEQLKEICTTTTSTPETKVKWLGFVNI